jgi:galactosamine-6-phosphate isomerase
MLRQVLDKPDSLVCLATGQSPLLAYREFVRLALESKANLSRVTFVKLDEWIGPPMDDPSTCEVFLQREILQPLGVRPDHYLSFFSAAPDPQAECQRINAELARRGPLDLAVLGLGRNGHLGLNEPAAELQLRAHVDRLSESTQGHAMLQSTQVPVRQGMTLGMGDLLAAHKLILLVTGAGKEAAFAELQKGTLNTACSATFLNLHSHLTCLADRQSLNLSQ